MPELVAALRRTAAEGFARVDGVLEDSFRRALWREIQAGPLRRMAGTFGRAGVRMEIDGFDVEAPFEGFAATAALAAAFGERVRNDGRGVRGLATWDPNEAGVGIYRPGSVGITAHLDGRWYRRLVAVFTVVGSAPFEIRVSREGELVDAWVARPGGVTLMRGPGLGGARDGRPFHAVAGPRRGIRCSLALRMRVGGPARGDDAAGEGGPRRGTVSAAEDGPSAQS
jgi:hypothetical protein